MSSPSAAQPISTSMPLAGTDAHGLKRSRDIPPLAQQPESPGHSPSAEPPAAPPVSNHSVDQPPLPLGHPPTPLAKKGRRLSNEDQTSPSGTNTSKKPHSNEGSEQGPPSRLLTPEATEVKSVRKKVEGMGVENAQVPSCDQSEDETMNSPSQPLGRFEDSSIATLPKQGDASSGNLSNQAPDDDQQKISPKAESDALEVTYELQNSAASQGSDHDQKTSLNSKSDASEADPMTSTQSKSDALPACWAPYSTSASPFATHAPTTSTSIFTDPKTKETSEPALLPPSSTASARAIASPRRSSPARQRPPQSTPPPLPPAGSSSLEPPSANFPTCSDFLLKGKRNNWIGRSPFDLDPTDPSHNKKPKLPAASTGFGVYSGAKPSNLNPDALAQLNSNTDLQVPSLTAPHLNVGRSQPQASVASSVCAVNGDSEGGFALSPPPSSAAAKFSSSPLGFSAFTKSSAFGSANNTPSLSASVFDLPGDSEATGRPDGSGGGMDQRFGDKKKTHLALAADLCEEDKHAGFGAKELITGEENENLVKSVRCKVFTLEKDGSWHERGSGGLRLLRTKLEPYRYRLIMRADAVHRVLLNVPIFKGFNYLPSQDKFMSFAGTAASSTIGNTSAAEDLVASAAASAASDQDQATSSAVVESQFQQYLCRFNKTEARQEMIESIMKCLQELETRPSEDQSKRPKDQKAIEK